MKLRYIFFFIILTLSTGLFAETALTDSDRFFFGQETDRDLAVILPENSFSKKGIQYGAILNPVYMFEDKSEGQLGSYLMNTKIWAKSYLWKNSFLYIRGKDSYLGVQKQDGIYSSVESDNIIDLDLAYISQLSETGSFSFSAGRKFYSIGSGLILNGRGDGAEITFNSYGFGINLLGLYTGLLNKDNNPYGLSDKDLTDGAKRAFGAAVADKKLFNQKIYIFGLIQKDLGEEESSEKTEYNSQYYGAGLEGVVLETLSYFAEFVYETGKSYLNVSNKETSISAYAVNSGIDYFIPVVLKPAVTLQYAFASGDKDRTNYTDSVRPETSNGNDNGFISFGTYSGGYALRPVLSNIHVIRAGLSFVPFSWTDSLSLKKIAVISKYSYYIKDKQKGVIKSGEAPNHKSFIGQGADISLRWQMFYDLSFYINYGLFRPGEAYDDTTSQNFVMAGINMSI